MPEKDQNEQHAEIRASTLAAFKKGGSVFVGGKFVTEQKDLPADHPARYDEGEGPAEGGDGGQSDALLLSRIVELETQCVAANTFATAADASRNQAELALEAVKRERDELQRQVNDLTKQLSQKLDYSAPNNSAAPKLEGAAAPVKTGEVSQPVPETTTAVATKTPLPGDFPKRDALLHAGIDTVEAVAAKSNEQLIAVDGITIRNVDAVKQAALAALEQAS